MGSHVLPLPRRELLLPAVCLRGKKQRSSWSSAGCVCVRGVVWPNRQAEPRISHWISLLGFGLNYFKLVLFALCVSPVGLDY